MPNLMTHKSWLERTYLLTRSRSKLLKEVDSRLAFYNTFPQPQNFSALRGALTAWMQSKGTAGAWTRDDRNKNGAVTDLWNQMHPKAGPTEQETAALTVMEDARKAFLVSLFTGARIESHNFVETGGKVAELARTLKSTVEKARSLGTATGLAKAGNAQALGTSALSGQLFKAAWGQVTTAFEGADFSDVLHMPEFMTEMETVIGVSVEELGIGMVAGAGLITSGGKTLWAVYKTSKFAHTSYKLGTHKSGFDKGDAMAAFKGLQEVIDREVALNALILATHAAEIGAKAGGMFADFGAGTTALAGIGGTIARLLISVGYMARDFKERLYANRMLQNPAVLDAKLFTECPILGCYFLCCADTSTIVSLMFSEIATTSTFMDKVNIAVSSQLEPTLKIANHAIYRHRFRLRGKNLPKLSVLAHHGASSLPVYKATGAMAMRGEDWTDRAAASVNNMKNLRGTNAKFY